MLLLFSISNALSQSTLQSPYSGYENDPDFVKAAYHGNLKTVKEQFSRKYKIDDDECTRALVVASIKGQLEVIKFLVSEGIDVNKKDKHLGSPILMAVRCNQTETIKYLLEKSAEKSPDNPRKWNLLHYAINNSQDAGLIEVLLRYGVTPDHKNFRGQTPLHFAARRAPEILKLLLDAGADVNIKDIKGQTPVFNAIDDQTKDNLQLFYKRGASIKEKDLSGRTPLFYSIQGCSLSTASMLLKMGADINRQDNHGATPLHIAAGTGILSNVEFLVKKGAQVNIKDKNGRTPVFWAAAGECDNAEKKKPDKVKLIYSTPSSPLNIPTYSNWDGSDLIIYLNKNGCDVNEVDYFGYTPFYFAYIVEDERTMTTLLKLGADVSPTLLFNLIKEKKWKTLTALLKYNRKYQLTIAILIIGILIILFRKKIRKQPEN